LKRAAVIRGDRMELGLIVAKPSVPKTARVEAKLVL
jgi:hypothetical protein